MSLAIAGVAHPVERHLAKVEVASSSLVTRSKKEATFVYQKLLLFYPSRRLGISSYFSVYIITVGVYHHRRCMLLRLDEIQHFVLMIYNASH